MEKSEEVLYWTHKVITKLIREFKKRPCLWDPGCRTYKSLPQKCQAWHEIATVFKCDVMDLKRKMNSVLASHRRERAKVRDGHHSNWHLYNELSFLPSHVDQPHNEEQTNSETDEVYFEENKDENEEGETEMEQQLDAGEEVPVEHETELEEQEGQEETQYIVVQNIPDEQNIYIKEEPVHHNEIVYQRQVRQLPQSLKDRRQKLKLNRTYPIKSNNNDIHRVKPHIRPRDECDSFGEYIASTLRKHDDRTRSMIKHAINNILYEQEMKKYKPRNSRVLIEEEEDNPLILP